MPRGQRRHRAQQFFLGASVLCAAFVLSIPAYAKKQTYAGLFLIHKAGGNVVWYVHPKDRKRYCMKTPEIAYELVPMIALQRILPKDIQKIPKKGESIRGRAFPKKYVGRLLIEQRHPPRLWYVDPRTKRRYRIEIPAEGRIALDVLTTRGVRVATQVLSAIPIAVGCPEEQSNGLQPPFARSIFVPSCETLQIRWDLSERADAYQIYRNGIAIGTVGSDTSTFIDTQLDATKKYTYGVLALNKQGTSPMTEFTSWQPHACPQQPQPSVAPSPSLVPTSSTLPTVLPSSSPSPRPTATPTPTNTPAPLPTPTPTPTPIPLPTPTPTIPPTPPPPGGATSTPIPLAANAVPPTPTFLGVVSVDCRTFLLRWNDVDGEDGYHIYRDGTLFGTTGKGVTEWKDSGLVPAFNYRYSLRAFNAFGDSAHSSTLSFKTGQCSAVGQTLAPPTAILINGTSLACAAKKGTTCLR
ncbi:fibronectin type III domain-containing protein, partial [Candidatus Uhrbacteria bacterium]|nr:fibronectin type III domain-containing protein [Candidatus Uhrbacteria bacterium]